MSIIVLYCRCQQTVEKVAGFDSCETSFFLQLLQCGVQVPSAPVFDSHALKFNLYDANK